MHEIVQVGSNVAIKVTCKSESSPLRATNVLNSVLDAFPSNVDQIDRVSRAISLNLLETCDSHRACLQVSRPPAGAANLDMSIRTSLGRDAIPFESFEAVGLEPSATLCWRRVADDSNLFKICIMLSKFFAS